MAEATKRIVFVPTEIVAFDDSCGSVCHLFDCWNTACTGFRTQTGAPRRMVLSECGLSYARLPECIEAEKRGAK